MSLNRCYGELVLDCVPDEGDVAGRDYWMTMACTAIFFDSLNLGTYKVADEDNNMKSRSLQEVRAGYEGCRKAEIERYTRERGKIGATWVFVIMAMMGYEESWKTGAVERGADPEAEDPWYDLLELKWAPVRYRYPVRYVLHFACAMVWEQQTLAHRGIVDPIHLKHLKERLALDILEFLGAEARHTLETMMADVVRRMKEQPDAHAFDLLYYPDEGWVGDVLPGDSKPSWFTPPFNERLKSLQAENVSILHVTNGTFGVIDA